MHVVPLQQRQWRRQTTSLRTSHLRILTIAKKIGDWVIKEEERSPKGQLHPTLAHGERTGFITTSLIRHFSRPPVIRWQRLEFPSGSRV